MKKSVKRVLSFILSAVMVLMLLPIISRPMMVEAEETDQVVAHTHGAKVEKCSEHDGWTPISTGEQLGYLCRSGGKGYLTENITVNNNIQIWYGIEVSLCLNGYSITETSRGEVFGICGTLKLYDEESNSGKITHETQCEGKGVYMDRGTFIMTGGEISGNIDDDFGCGVYVEEGTFMMKGGKISDNKCSLIGGYGGGVFVSEGIFIMMGGEISENTSTYGGGVAVLDGTFIMEGGQISENWAETNPNIYIYFIIKEK